METNKINEMDYMSHSGNFYEAIFTHLTVYYTDINTEEKLISLLYEHYTLRLYTERGTVHCINNALNILAFLCLTMEPEKQIVMLLEEYRDLTRHRFLRIHKDTSHVNNLPVAFILDGIFSALWYMLNSMKYRSRRLTIAMNMIQRNLYPYLISLPDTEKGIITDWDTMMYTPGEETLMDTLKGIEEKIKVNLDTHLYFPSSDKLKETTGNFDLEQVRLLISLSSPSKEEQELLLNEVVTAVRNYYIDINSNNGKLIFTPPFRESSRLMDAYGNEELKANGRIRIDMDNYDNEIKRIAMQLGIPPAWGTTINYSDDMDDHSVTLHKKLEQIWYGTSTPEEIASLLPDTGYTCPEWIKLPDDPKALNYGLYIDVCEKMNMIKKWERGIERGDVNMAIAMMLNIRQNTQETCALALLFEKRHNTSNPFNVTLLNLLGHISALGYLDMTDREITTCVFGQNSRDGLEKNVKKGREADLPDKVKDALMYMDSYLNDIRRYREYRAKIFLE